MEDEVTHPGLQFNLGPVDNTVLGRGSSSNSNQALIFSDQIARQILAIDQTLRALSYANMAPLLERHRDLLKPEVVWNIEKGLALTGAEIARAEEADTLPSREHAVSLVPRATDVVLTDGWT